jgi:U4/U6.U5 tri-snRNP component SNU23
MADSKKSAYGGSTANDVSFRRTWDRAEYAERAAKREAKEREEGKARYEAKLAGKKYVRRASTPPDVRETQARGQRLDVGAMVGKTMLVPAGAAVGKRGRGAGFYCEACDLTFKDNLQLVEHYNSKQHQIQVGESGEVKRAGVEEVRERLKWLKRKIEEDRKEELINLSDRLEFAREKDEREREEKRRKRREKRRKTQDGVGVQQPDFEDDGVIR